ncbi:hypothetical protein INS49_001695 [Diaporthe citri]|uniref:uncharacterized protein n=1 Tax=Diaporthe citri TaxID=83186 RepID=UPI001C80F42D|nr:uncharacterized protein INS49_001695 [Diaporthe citri]KAG6367505.1 hypothetical protein INS49_001695 [Diaporthe citri]
MNFSTLRDIYLEESLRVLGHGNPDPFTVIAGLKKLARSGSADAAFTHYQHRIKCLVQVRESLAFWEESIGAEAFDKKHARSRDVRHEYLKHTFRLVYVIADLSFPESLREYTEEMSEVLKQGDLQQHFILDSEVTYARSKERTRAGLTSPHHQCPRRFVPHGLRKLTPHFYYNPDLYGHLQVANEACIKQRKDHPEVFLNLGRLNTWDIQ